MELRTALTELEGTIITQINNCKEYIEWHGQETQFGQTLGLLESTLDDVKFIKFQQFGEPVAE